MRALLDVVHLKPNEDGYKVAVLAGADRLNTQAANIFLKTLEEPPQRSVLLLLSTEPQRLLETILSRCLRLKFGTGAGPGISDDDLAWLEAFSRLAASEESSLIGRYRLLGLLLSRLAEKRAAIEQELEKHSTTTLRSRSGTNGNRNSPRPLRRNTAISAWSCCDSCSIGCATSG